MARIPVPDDYDRDHIVVCGTADYHYPESDVQVDDRHARNLRVRADDDGRYCGPPEQYADAVREFLGVEVQGESDACTVEKADGEVCGRELPCPYHSEDDS